MNKKGFTLIELLAVLVVLAILAFIAIPIVIGIINNARENSYKRNIESYGRAVENAVGQYLLDNDITYPTDINLSDLDIQTTGTEVICDSLSLSENGIITLERCRISEDTSGTTYKYSNKKVTKEKIYDIYNVGDKIKVNDEYYWVISDSDKRKDYVVALKDEPLTTEEVNLYGESGTDDNHVNRYTYASIGQAYPWVKSYGSFGGMAYYSSLTCGYTTPKDYNSWTDAGCTSNYGQSDVKYVVDNWAHNTFKNNELKVIGTYSARLISFDEAHNLGYGDVTRCGTGCLYYSPTDDVPNWLYNTGAYWTMTPADNSNFNVWRINQGYIEPFVINSHNQFLMVRPVINVYKSAIE